ncbi:MAG: helicase, partial [Desulfobulbaceae bacterium]|nr:helicase [Desulfobulbaceae bacterium]
PPSESRLQAAKISYQQQLLLDCFDFGMLRNRMGYLVRLLLGNAGVVQISGVTDIHQLEKMATENIFVVSDNFKRQLHTIFASGNLPETDAAILERISKASRWFQNKFALVLGESVQKLHIDTDNAELRKKITNTLNNLKKEIAVKLAGVQCCEKEFSPSKYLRAVSAAEIDFLPQKDKKRQPPAYTESDVAHPELFQTLKDWRSQKAKVEEVAHFQILHQRVLIQIVIFLPDNTADLMKIKGVGKKTAQKYGKELVKLVSAYRQKHGIDEVVLPEPKKPADDNTQVTKEAPPSDTKQICFDMFNKGGTIAQIAKERGLVKDTIEGHLSFYVEKGTLDIDKLLSPEKQQAITKKLAASQNNSLGEIKKDLGDDYSYGEIKMMLAHQKHLASK